jgi:hypothetical protein
MDSRGVRLDKAALFESLGYTPHAGQLEIHRSNARFRVVSCGVRFGKSTLAIYECIAEMMVPRSESIGWVVAPTYDLSERIFGRVLAVVNKHLKHRIKLISERDRRVVIVNAGGGTSELRAKSADNSDSLLGEGLDYVVVDEAARLDAAIYHEHLSQRLLDRHGRALLISTPNGFDWFARLHRRGQRGRDAEVESWSGASWRNPALDRGLIEQERARLAADAFASLYGGEFVGEDPFPCDACHGPDPNVSGLVLLRENEQIAECAECGHPVDDTGHTLVRREGNGMAVFQSITLIPREDCQIHLPPGKAGESHGGVLIEPGDREHSFFEVDG